MNFGQYVRVVHKADPRMQLFGRFAVDNSTPSDPPTWVRVEIDGVGKIQFDVINKWTLESVLPHLGGTVIVHNLALYVLVGNDWYHADSGLKVSSFATFEKEGYKIVFDPASIIKTGVDGS